MACMRDKHNNSSQMRELLQPDDNTDRCQKGRHVPEGEQRDTANTDKAHSCSFQSSRGEVERGGEEKRSDQVREQREATACRCCLLEDLKRLPQCHVKPEPLSCSRTHTVLVDVAVFNSGGGLKAHEGRDVWFSDFVKMPCSPASFMTAKSRVLKMNKTQLRWDVISKELDGLARKTKVTVDDVMKAVMEYNPKYKGQWSFDALHSFFKCMPKAENYSPTLFPKIAALASRLHNHVKMPIPLLQKGRSASITLSQVQISCLLANAFYCTFPHRNTTTSNAEYHNYPTINFSSLFGHWSARKKEKLRAIFHYFKMVTDDNNKPGGLVTFERHCLRDMPKWRSSEETMPKLHVTSDGCIETEGTGMLQVDFACSLIGGGVLTSGLVQEEILFLMNPELIVSRLFTERLEDNECLIIKGTQQFSCYSGFSDNFEWAGPHEDLLAIANVRDGCGRLPRQILAIDALRYKHGREQYNMINVTRELNKAYCGFRAYGQNDPDIATGKWGCGAFNGDPQLKATIQLMAAAVAKKGMAFFTFGNKELKESLQQIYHPLAAQGITVGTLYGFLENYCAVIQSADGSHVDLFQFIRSNLKG